MTAFGPLICDAATAIAARTQAPVALAAHHLLTLAAMAAQRRVSVRLPTGALRPASCYLVTLIGPGEGRGALVKAIVDPLRAPPAGLAAAIAERRPGFFTEARAPGKADRYRVYRAQSALIADRAENVVAPGRLRRAEASSLAALWDGRVEPGSAMGTTVHSRLSLHLVAAPREGFDVLGDPDLADGGLLGRLLVAAPASRIGARVWVPCANEDPPGPLTAFHAHVKTLTRQDSSAHTNAVTFTEAAASQWFAFAREVEEEMRADSERTGAFATIRPLAGRLAEHAARLAVIIAFMENEALTQVGEGALSRGIALARFYAAEALRLGDLTPVTRTEITDQLQIWLERTHAECTVTLRDICRSGPPSVRDADIAYRHMRRLERLGVVRQKTLMPESAGGARRAGVSYAWHVGLQGSPAHTPDLSRGVA